MRTVPVLNLGQAFNYIKTGDFRAYVDQVNASMRAIADIAREYGLSGEEIQAINSELAKVSGFTLPMMEAPKCDSDAPSWLMLVGAGLLGALIGSAL